MYTTYDKENNKLKNKNKSLNSQTFFWKC
jgi:hypothetical protein